MTSAGTSAPGLTCAARVARVTPSLMHKCPSFPRTTCSGGIPASESPCLASCRASLKGSAPCGRLGGRCSSPGSTSMNSDIRRLIALLEVHLGHMLHAMYHETFGSGRVSNVGSHDQTQAPPAPTDKAFKGSG